jgi:hypothetical protein
MMLRGLQERGPEAEGMSSAPTTTEAPLLRTLAPALRGLERGLRAWLDGPRRYPLSTLARAALEGISGDLKRQADSLETDRPLLVVMLMGGTGVGKSSLLNALAGGAVAQASFTRPTTRDPVVYYHTSVRVERLDPALRHCRLAPHDRPALQQKVLVDTPDLDSNDLANRDKLLRLLPVADVVLYIGSQEKYHDQIGWELFLQQRKRRAFAFVLNKWDRCVHTTATGLRPDEDLLRDLKAEGFDKPIMFRTCAQAWVERQRENAARAAAADGAPPTALSAPELPEGEQFPTLVEWLENGLTRLEIEAIKARGVGQLLAHLEAELKDATPPDLTEAAARTRTAWAKPLGEEAASSAEVLLNTLEPYQREIEHHFRIEGQRRFRGLMGGYLKVVTWFAYFGGSVRDRLPFAPKSRETVDAPAAWDMARFARACSDVAANKQLDARGKAFANRLLVAADASGFALGLLADPVESVSKMDWRQRYAEVLSEVLQEVEKKRSQPTGFRRYVQAVLGFLADWAPPAALVAAMTYVLIKWFQPSVFGPETHGFEWIDLAMPPLVTLVVLVILHVLIAVLMPVRWAAIRDDFRQRLEVRLKQELENAYGPVPADVAAALDTERKQVEQLSVQTREVSSWLRRREESASVSGLYGQ